MDRRSFLKNLPLLAGGVSFFQAAKLYPSSTRDRDFAGTDVSLHVVTDNPDRAIASLDGILKTSSLWSGNIQFTEYPLAGNHVADLVLIEDNQLIDYRTRKDDLSLRLQGICKDLGLPRSAKQPTFIKFSTESTQSTPQHVNIFHDNVLVDRLAIGTDRETYKLDGDKGSVTLSVKNNRVKVISSTCRHKTCMSMGGINAPGQHVVCIPNKMRISIEGQNISDVDGITY